MHSTPLQQPTAFLDESLSTQPEHSNWTDFILRWTGRAQRNDDCRRWKTIINNECVLMSMWVPSHRVHILSLWTLCMWSSSVASICVVYLISEIMRIELMKCTQFYLKKFTCFLLGKCIFVLIFAFTEHQYCEA